MRAKLRAKLSTKAGAAVLAAVGLPAPTAVGILALAAVLAAVVTVPLLWAASASVAAAWDAQAWRDFGADPQWRRALIASMVTGLSATVLSWAVAAWVLSRSFPGPRWSRVVPWLTPLLAVPHAAFAIGLVFLVSPSGWILRLLSPWATGFEAPPPWLTSQDPWGLGLTLGLIAKEVPFLLWTAAAQLQRVDVGARWAAELQVAHSLGYQPGVAWRHIVWPQLWRRMGAPTVAVLAYSLTVVDMAMVMGPTSPPTLSVLAWQWLQDADVAVNAQGAVAAWVLGCAVAVCAGGLALWRGRSRWPWRWRHKGNRYRDGRRGEPSRLSRRALACRRAVGWLSAVSGSRAVRTSRVMAGLATVPVAFLALCSLYALVLLALAVGSVSGVWPFPAVWPDSFSAQGWASVASSAPTLLTTLWLGLASASAALLWSVAWLELAPAAWDAWMRRGLTLPLLLPSVLWVLGVHRLSLTWGLDGQGLGVWLAHCLAVLPYVLIALRPAYMGFDVRYAHTVATLGHGRWTLLWRVKWPLLRAALASAFAVGFAVSTAQYLPTVFVGAGRFATVTTEAVTLASGAQRSLMSAYAALQMLLPVLAFALAAYLGRPRQFEKIGSMKDNT